MALTKHRAPADPTVLATFISTLIGIYGGSTIKNFVYGMRAWHIMHGIPWKIEENEVQALLTAGKHLVPATSSKAPKVPWTIDNLTTICSALDPNHPIDAAVLACLTTAFWGTARLGEVMVPKLDGFDPRIHVKVSDIRFGVRDRNNLEETIIFLPWTKSSREKGENIFCARQEGITNPQAALTNHLKVNKPIDNGHLFTHKHPKDGTRPLSHQVFTSCIKKIALANNLSNPSGHGIRVGSTLEYLLRGVPFDVIKAKGRWQSEAFKGYLREHTQIMAPYMQAHPDPKIFDTLMRYAMPPVRDKVSIEP